MDQNIFEDEELKKVMEKRWEEFLVATKLGASDMIESLGEDLSLTIFKSIDIIKVKKLIIYTDN